MRGGWAGTLAVAFVPAIVHKPPDILTSLIDAPRDILYNNLVLVSGFQDSKRMEMVEG